MNSEANDVRVLLNIMRSKIHAKTCNPAVGRCVDWCPCEIARRALIKRIAALPAAPSYFFEQKWTI